MESGEKAGVRRKPNWPRGDGCETGLQAFTILICTSLKFSIIKTGFFLRFFSVY